MQIILLDKVVNLGDLGDEVKVRSGYARNYLIPKGKAVSATKQNKAYFETRRAELVAKVNKALAAAQARVTQLEALGSITLFAKAGEEGKLFGSVGARDIAEAVTAAGVEVERSEVRLPEGPLRMLGEHEVSFQLHSEVFSTLNIVVVPKQ